MIYILPAAVLLVSLFGFAFRRVVNSILPGSLGMGRSTSPTIRHGMKSVLSGGATASLLFPTSTLALTFVWAFWLDVQKTKAGFVEPRLLDAIGLVLFVFAVFTVIWSAGIFLLIPVWRVIDRLGARGLRAAAGVVAIASVGLALSVPALHYLALVLYPEPVYLLVIGLAGCCGGLVFWYSIHKPGLIGSWLRFRPISSGAKPTSDF